MLKNYKNKTILILEYKQQYFNHKIQMYPIYIIKKIINYMNI